MKLLEQLLYEVDGEAAVRVDAATIELDALLEARALTPFARMQVQVEITRRRREAIADVDVRRGAHADLLRRATMWDERAVGALAEQAKERATGMCIDAAAVAEEIAEYEATVRRLDEISQILERAGLP